jgi:hypothetical protein
LTALCAALATATRPEGLLLFSIIALARFINIVKNKSFDPDILKYILSIFIFAVIAFPYFIFSYKVSGHFFPNTFKGQGGDFYLFPGFNYLRVVVIYFFRDNFITGTLYLGGFVYILANFRRFLRGEFRTITIFLIWLYLLPLVSSFLVPNWRHHVRYMIPVIPIVNMAAVYFLSCFIEFDFLRKVKSFLIIAPKRYAFVLLFSLLYYFLFAYYIGKNTQNINDQQVKLGNWVKENVKRDETIAVNDIGAITYISKNRVVDMAGLVTPEVLRYRQYSWDDNLDSLNYLLKRNNVNYIIIYDNWFKEYLDKYEKNLRFVTSAFLEHNTICGGVEMKVYKTKFKP